VEVTRDQAHQVLRTSASILAAGMRRATSRDGAGHAHGGDPDGAEALERHARTSGRIRDADADALVQALAEVA